MTPEERASSRDIEWRQCIDLPDYEVSEYGDVRRVTPAKTRRVGHMPKGHINQWGYRVYKLVTPNGKERFWGHRLVLGAFIGPPPSEKHQTAHTDGNRLNNHVSNLRWATSVENGADTVRHGSLKGERNGRALLSEDRVRALRDEYASLSGNKYGRRGRVALIQAKYGISRSALLEIINRTNWGHIK